MTVEKIATQLTSEWSNKTVGDLCTQAETEHTGIAFDAIRMPGALRLFIVMCITKPDQIERVERCLMLSPRQHVLDRGKLTLAEGVALAIASKAMLTDIVLTPAGAVRARFLIAADPLSVQKIESLFTLPDAAE
jgi:hypothetical protein